MINLTITIMQDDNSGALLTLCRDVENNKYFISNSTDTRNNTLFEVSQNCFSEIFMKENLSIYTTSKKSL